MQPATSPVAATGLLTGALTVRLLGLDRLPDLAEQLKPGSRKKLASVLSMLTAVAKPVQVGGATAYQIPLTVQNGKVAVGGLVPIGDIPPLKF